MRLAELQALVHRALRGEVPLEAASASLGVASWQLGVYRDLVADHVPRTLAKVYPSVRAIVGPAWDELAAAFAREVPAALPELNACVAPFPDWLAARTDDLAPSLPTLAQLEQLLFAAFAHEAQVPDRPQDLDPAELAPNPTLALLEVSYAVVGWLAAHPDPSAVTPATPPPERLAAPELALVFRRAGTHSVAFHVATDARRFALKVASERVPLADAARLADVPLAVARAALDEARALGLLV